MKNSKKRRGHPFPKHPLHLLKEKKNVHATDKREKQLGALTALFLLQNYLFFVEQKMQVLEKKNAGKGKRIFFVAWNEENELLQFVDRFRWNSQYTTIKCTSFKLTFPPEKKFFCRLPLLHKKYGVLFT